MKNRVAASLAGVLALALIGGIALAAHPARSTTADVVVWQSASDRSVLYLSTRAGDSAWQTSAAPLALEPSGSARFLRFAAAGDHFNPTNVSHGALFGPSRHASDLPNLYAAADGTAAADVFTAATTLTYGEPIRCSTATARPSSSTRSPTPTGNRPARARASPAA